MSPGRRSVVPHVVDAVGLTAFLLAAVSVIGVLQNRATPVLPAHSRQLDAVRRGVSARAPPPGAAARAACRRLPLPAHRPADPGHRPRRPGLRTGGRVRLTVALVDVDGLRAVNNRLGHAAGDQYLTTVAARLRRATPAGGQVARLG